MERKIITEEKKNILVSMKKDFIPVMTDNKEVFVYDTPVFRDFCKLVEADCDTLCRLGLMYRGEIGYKTENGLYIATCLMMKDGCIVEGFSVELESDEDFLGLFEKKEKDKEADDFFNDSVENIFLKLKEEHADVYEFIKGDIISHIQDYDLEESTRENIANDWIADNPNIAVDMAKDYLCDDDMKDLIKDMVDSL